MATETVINSLTEYVDRIISLKPNKNINSFQPEKLVFRGLSCKDYHLVPSLGRQPVEKLFNSYQFVEGELVSQAMQKYPDEFSNLNLPIAVLAKLQHFGLPTRMLDVTSSALVGLYFACQQPRNGKSSDGEVVVFSKVPLPVSNVFANIIADTYRLTNNRWTDFNVFLYRALKQDYCVTETFPGWEQKLDEICDDLYVLIEKPLLVDSLESSSRQKNQQGKYIIFPNSFNGDKDSEDWLITDSLVKLEKNDPSIIERIIIPADKKADILRKLRLLGITEEFLFADNIDIVLKNIKDKQTEDFEVIAEQLWENKIY